MRQHAGQLTSGAQNARILANAATVRPSRRLRAFGRRPDELVCMNPSELEHPPDLDRRRPRAGAGRLAAALACAVAAIALAPLLWGLGVAFVVDGHVSLAHFREALAGAEQFRGLLWNTTRVSVGTAALAVMLGVPLGLALFRCQFPLRRVLLAVAVAAPLVPMPVVVGAWLSVLGIQGWATPALKPAFAAFGMHYDVHGLAGAVWVMGAAYAPLVALVVGSAALRVPRCLEDDARLDGSRFSVLRRVTLPHCLPALMAAAALVLALNTVELAVTDVLRVRTFSEVLYADFQLTGDAGRMAAMALPATLLLAAAFAAALACARSWWRGLLASSEGSTAGGARRSWLAFGVAAGVLALHPGVPVASLVVKLGSPATLVSAAASAWPELRTGLGVSVLAATLAVAAAFPLAASARGRRVVAVGVLTWLAVSLAAPAPLVGMGLTRLLNRPGLLGWIYDSPAVLALACFARFLPIAVLACIPAVNAISRDLEAAAELDGAGAWQRLVEIVAPLCWRGMATAWVLVFALSMGELGASVLVAPPGKATLAIRVFTFLHYGVDDALAAICLLLLASVAAPVLVLLCVVSWQRPR